MHLDIKPENIMYSTYFQKPVFIDYGFSLVISESFGDKTYISFRGTPSFSSP